MGASWTWNASAPRAVERLWRYVDPDADHVFYTSAFDGRPAAERLADVLSAIRHAGIRYRFEPALHSTHPTQQPIRPPASVWHTREATCLDLALIAASCLATAGIRVWVVVGVIGEGRHAWLIADLGAELHLDNWNVAAMPSLEEWEAQNYPADGPDEDFEFLRRRVAVEPDRYRAIDVASLMIGYPNSDGRAAATLDEAYRSGADCTADADGARVSDLASWWSRAMVVPLGGSAPATVSPGRRRAVAAIAVVATLAGGAVWGAADLGTGSPPDPTISTTVPPTISSTTTTTPSPEVETKSAVLQPAKVEATCQSASGNDSGMAPTSYEPARAVDGDPSTAWRCDGNAVGQWMTLTFDGKVHIDSIRIIPGYAKTDPSDGIDRFAQNRKISRVRYQFDDSMVDVSLPNSASPVPTDVNVDTTKVLVVILETRVGTSVLDHGGVMRPPSDKSPISEVTIVGHA